MDKKSNLGSASAVVEDFNRQFLAWMNKLRIRQKDLSSKLGVSRQAISSLLGGRNTNSLRAIEKLCRLLGLKLALVIYEPCEGKAEPGGEVFRRLWKSHGCPANYEDSFSVLLHCRKNAEKLLEHEETL